MNKSVLTSFYSWFDDYVNKFNNDNKDIQQNITLKKEHTKRVCSIMNYITDSLSLDEEMRNISEVTALFHDIGRFEQYKRFQTFVDHKSVDHAKLGAQILRNEGILQPLSGGEQYNIIKAIEYHNIRELPKDEPPSCLLNSKLIRDADKLDIYHIIIEYLDERKINPNRALEVWPRNNEYSPEVVESIMNDRCVDYKDLKTFYDRRLLEISWVYDINFDVSLSYVKERGYIDRLFKELPEDDVINRVQEHVYGRLIKQ